MTEGLEIYKAHCNRCDGIRNSFVRASFTKRGSDQDSIVDWADTFRILECCGCEEIIVQHSYYFSEDYSYEKDATTGEMEVVPNIKVSYFPPAVFRRLPSWLDDLEMQDELLAEVLREVYVSLHNDALITATAGTRILLDRAMIKLVGDRGGFEQKLNLMVDQGIIGKEDRELLSVMTDAGSAASHRGYRPSREHLGIIIDTVENLLQRKFVLQNQAHDIRGAVPKRSRSMPQSGRRCASKGCSVRISILSTGWLVNISLKIPVTYPHNLSTSLRQIDSDANENILGTS
jgi:hypothetical protein